MKRIAVFCGSSSGNNDVYSDAAKSLGRCLAHAGIGLVFGGGKVGLMGAIADAVLTEGGEAIGVIPQALMTDEQAHRGLTELKVVVSMHERKALMEKWSDAFICLPGGFGTLDEFCEIITWAQLQIHAKPCGLLNVAGYFDDFLRFIDQSVHSGFVRSEHRDFIRVATDPEGLVADLQTHAYAPVPKRQI